MSAFIVDDDVYAALARFLQRERPDIEESILKDYGLTALTFAECLRIANHKSMQALYGDPMPKRGELKALDVTSGRGAGLHPAAAIRHLDCIDYQSCEYAEWQHVRHLVRAVQGEIARVVVANLDVVARKRAVDEAQHRLDLARREFRKPHNIEICRALPKAEGAWGHLEDETSEQESDPMDDVNYTGHPIHY